MKSLKETIWFSLLAAYKDVLNIYDKTCAMSAANLTRAGSLLCRPARGLAVVSQLLSDGMPKVSYRTFAAS